MGIFENNDPEQSQEILQRTVRDSREFEQTLKEFTHELKKRIFEHARNEGLSQPDITDRMLTI